MYSVGVSVITTLWFRTEYWVEPLDSNWGLVSLSLCYILSWIEYKLT